MRRFRYHPAQRAAALAITCMFTLCADRPSFMMLGGPADPPSGLVTMCHAAGAKCDVAPAQGSRRPTTLNNEAKVALAGKINRKVNGRVWQVSDKDRFGMEEVWAPTGSGRRASGDCEDIALEKRDELLAQGYPDRELNLAVVYSRGVGLHVVLVATMQDGDYVLDSMTPFIDRWDRTEYTWVVRQEPGRILAWRSIARAS